MEIMQLFSEGFLVVYDETISQQKREILSPGSLFQDYAVISKLQGVFDTEVFKVKKENQYYALKIFKTNDHIPYILNNFENEVKILKHLDSEINPGLIAEGTYEGFHYIIMDWCEGIPWSHDRLAEQPEGRAVAGMPFIIDAFIPATERAGMNYCRTRKRNSDSWMNENLRLVIFLNN